MINQTTFAQLLEQAVTQPGTIGPAYRAFHGYSIGNQMLAAWQCREREIALGPIATYQGWKDKGRQVREGEKAIHLVMPVTCKRRQAADNSPTGDASESGECFTRFVYRPNWFVMSQTDGEPFALPVLPTWELDRALEALTITRIQFDHPDGNCQGFARHRSVAVSPIAGAPIKTLIHEIAHVLLGHTAEAGANLTDSDVTPRSLREVEAEAVALVCLEALDLPGADDCRGYIQWWNANRGAEPIPERSAQRIFKAADQILKAGRPAEGKELQS
jgi:hypothetical protein